MPLTGARAPEVSEFSSYPPGLDDLPQMLEQEYDVIVIDLDGDPEIALELVESIGANGAATVMVYSESADPELLVRCMRAGAREFLTFPFSADVMAEALVRAAARRPEARHERRSDGKAAMRSWVEGRRRRDHGGLQFCRGAGQGIGREDAADRSGSAAGRCGAESGNYGGVLDDRCAGSRRTGWTRSFCPSCW